MTQLGHPLLRKHTSDIRESTFINMADELTDVELRRQLLQLGAKPVGPITATTRPIYVKKLNHLKVAAKKTNAAAAKSRAGRKLLGFSSDESEVESSPEPVGRRQVGRRKESSVAVKTKNKSGTSNSHAYLGRPPLRSANDDHDHKSNRLSYSVQGNFNSIGGESGLGRTSDIGSRRSVRLARPSASTAMADPNGFDSSDSDVDHDSDDANCLDETDYEVVSPEKVSVSVNTSPRLDDSSLFNRTLSKLAGVGTMWGSVSRDRLSYSRSIDQEEQNNSYSRLTRSYRSDTADEKSFLNHRSSRQASPSSTDRHGIDLRMNERTHTTVPPKSTTNSQQNTLSSNTTYHREHPNSIRQRAPMLNNSITNHIGQDDKLSDEENILQQGFKTKEDPSSYNMSQNISIVLVFLVTIFFVALAGIYFMSMHSTRIEVADIPSSDNWLICPTAPSGNENAVTEPCYTREKVEAAREVVQELAEMLSVRAGDYECARSALRNMTKASARIRLTNKWGNLFGDDGKKFNFMIALHLIHKNPHWKISLYNEHGEIAARHVDTEWMESQVPYYGFLCQAKQVAVTVCYIIAGLLLVVLLVGLGWWRLKRREEEKRCIYHMVERIIDILKAHHDKCQTSPDLQPYLAIPHVRDMLIPPKDRRKLQARWDMAVKFLSANESRIRVETQKISGEEFAVWRWLQTHVNGKVWQGPAFGENRDVNFPNLKNFKFQCLKIRNMFDPDIECDDDWHVHIENAILEKVSHGDGRHGIVHIAVDKTSREGCVYCKCSSAQEAAKAYRALHGWWFDNNLVTVKYLRLERYYERYPEASKATTPLTPSNNQCRSLSQPYHHSIYESC